ncbi:MAG: ribosomal L7Ae/L30e/S12e/Gadd45 family protein [Sporomusaceae bacterium]|nr:ribosomal L7Ae/L30e/S12e/Gadd45 family protein [Sporomusaceae bacterium]
MINEQKISSLLGLAQKAGKLSSGELAVEKAVKSGQAKLLIIATDCSAATKKGYRDMTAYYHVELHELFSKEQLGACIGKVYRAALAVTDAGFSTAIKKLLDCEKDEMP